MNMIDRLTGDNIVPFLADIFHRRGGEEYLGEPVTMAEHMLQGAYFAQQQGEADNIVVAALLHDIGHFTSEFGTFAINDTKDRFHEAAGAAVLEPFFPDAVVACVQHHVDAKRYLCAVEPAYFEKLSDASVHSLSLQGGPMTDDEVAVFQSNPHIDAIVKVRLLDDQGKVAGLDTPLFQHYELMIQSVVDAHVGGAMAFILEQNNVPVMSSFVTS